MYVWTIDTATVDPLLALPAQSAMVIGLLTVELSLIAKSVALVDAAQLPLDGGGSFGSVPVYSSLFGVLASPGLVILFTVALSVSAVPTCAGVASGWSARYSAAAPATCGVAIDVPLMVF